MQSSRDEVSLPHPPSGRNNNNSSAFNELSSAVRKLRGFLPLADSSLQSGNSSTLPSSTPPPSPPPHTKPSSSFHNAPASVADGLVLDHPRGSPLQPSPLQASRHETASPPSTSLTFDALSVAVKGLRQRLNNRGVYFPHQRDADDQNNNPQLLVKQTSKRRRLENGTASNNDVEEYLPSNNDEEEYSILPSDDEEEYLSPSGNNGEEECSILPDAAGKKRERAPKYGGLVRERYKDLVQELAAQIKPFFARYKAEHGSLPRLTPPDVKSSILDPFIKENELEHCVVASETFAKHLWDKAATVAAAGRIRNPKRGGRELGEQSTIFDDHHTAVTKARESTAKRVGFVASFLDGAVGADSFVGHWKERRKIANKYHDIFTRLHNSDSELAIDALDILDDMMPEGESIDIFAMAMAMMPSMPNDVSAILHNDSEDFLEQILDRLHVRIQAMNVLPVTRDNARKIIKSVGIHQYLFAHMMCILIRKGLAWAETLVDEDGNEYMEIFTFVPYWLIFEYCQGQAYKLLGDATAFDVREPVDTGGSLVIGLLGGGIVINTDAFNGEGGYYDEESGRIFQILSITENTYGPIQKYDVSMPITGVTLQLHQVALATGHYYGINANLECHHCEGGLLYGALDENETMADLNCVAKCPATRSLIADLQLENDDVSQRCDGDHVFSRSTRHFNGLWFVQGVSHRENILRSSVRNDIKEWLFPLHVGAYDGGNDFPGIVSDRLL